VGLPIDSNPNADTVIAGIASNIKSVFENYQPQLDSGSQIVAPYEMSGSAINPEITVSVQKCVTIICQTVALDAMITLEKTTGSCDQNYNMVLDLTKSSSTLSDVYSSIVVSVCYHKGSNGTGSVDFSGSATEAPNYSGGEVADQIFDFLQLQIEPMAQAFQDTIAGKKN
jgi:hypothetical protein